MVIQPKRRAPVDAHRLERGPAAQHRAVVSQDQRFGGVDHAATEHGESKRR